MDINLEDGQRLQGAWAVKADSSDSDRRITGWLDETVDKLKPPPVQVGIPVADNTALKAILPTLKGGEILDLGMAEFQISISNLVFEVPVTIRGKGVVTKLLVKDSQGFTFTDLEFYSRGTGGFAYTVTASKDVLFSGLNAHGSLDSNPGNDASGFEVTKSERVAFVGNEFQQLRRAVVSNNTTGFTFRGNDVHDMDTDGMLFAEMTDVLIDGNFFGQFWPVGGAHPDAIQFMTAGVTKPCRKIVISHNLVVRGAGGGMQGIFMGNEKADPELYQDFEIYGNTLIGTGYRGISIGYAKGVRIFDNELWGQSQVLNGKVTGISNGIFTQSVDGVEVYANKSSSPIGFDNNTNATQSDNTLTSKAATDAEVVDVLRRWKTKGGFFPARLEKLIA